MRAEQAAFIGTTAEPGAEPEDEPSRSKVITLAHLRRSIADCHRIEDAIWRKLRAVGITPSSSAARIANGLRYECAAAPSWCEQAAWDRIAASMLAWARTFGNLQIYVDLRSRKERPAPAGAIEE